MLTRYTIDVYVRHPKGQAPPTTEVDEALALHLLGVRFEGGRFVDADPAIAHAPATDVPRRAAEGDTVAAVEARRVGLPEDVAAWLAAAPPSVGGVVIERTPVSHEAPPCPGPGAPLDDVDEAALSADPVFEGETEAMARRRRLTVAVRILAEEFEIRTGWGPDVFEEAVESMGARPHDQSVTELGHVLARQSVIELGHVIADGIRYR